MLPDPSSGAWPATDVIETETGPLTVTALHHASVQLEYGQCTLLVDPTSAGTYRKAADIVLITHGHGDHLDMEALRRLVGPGTVLVTHPSCLEKLRELPAAGITALEPYQHVTFDDAGNSATGIDVMAIPAYNQVRSNHPPGMGSGYVIELGGRKIYVAGDTEAIAEMKALQNIEAAFLPMNGPTMSPDEAAEAARAFRPRVVYPYHFGKERDNPRLCAAALEGSGIEVRILDWYPAAI